MVQIWHGKGWFKNLQFSLWDPLILNDKFYLYIILACTFAIKDELGWLPITSWVNIGSDNGLVLWGSQRLPKPMLTQIYVTILFMCRDHSVYPPSQWEMALHCNTVSHWLGAYTEWSLHVISHANTLPQTWILVDPLQRVHVSIENPTDLLDRVWRVPSGVICVDMFYNLLQVLYHPLQLGVDVLC